MAADGIVRLSKIEFYRNNSLTLESSLFNLDGWRCRLSWRNTTRRDPWCISGQGRNSIGYLRYSEGDSPRYRWTYRLK